MSDQPIYTAIELLRAAVGAVLPSAHWQRNDSANPARPYLVYDSQDKGGLAYNHVSSQGWRGLITVRAIGDYQDQADATLAPVFAAMNAITTPSAGYHLAAVYDRRLVLPPSNGTRYAAAQWEVFIERT